VYFPASYYWRELSEYYPDAKIILSIRDAQRWFDSTQKTIFSRRVNTALAGTKWGRVIKATIHDHLGDPNDRDTVIAAFNAHNQRVQEAFGADRLLVFNAKDGWAPLCRFLGVPEPGEDYPNVNSTEEFEGVLEMIASPMGPHLVEGRGAPSGPLHDELFKKD